MYAIYHRNGINWTWYILCKHLTNGSIEILGMDRRHNSRDPHPESSGAYDLLESQDNTRTITHVTLKPVSNPIPVCNPNHIFAYSDTLAIPT